MFAARCGGVCDVYSESSAPSGKPGCVSASSQSAIVEARAERPFRSLADLAANREAMGRLLTRRNPACAEAVRSMQDLLGATEDEFRERAGWEWVLEAAVRRSCEQQCDIAVTTVVPLRETAPADVRGVPAGAVTEWSHSAQRADIPLQRA